ncbi:MAG: N-6 DNA methylase [Rhodocyclales bacterium]|nr:N-6 DNA methylase [Rhodocyclales bacterium]
MNTTSDQLLAFGARLEDCVALHCLNDPRMLRYVDLMRHEERPLVDTVVETQAQALLYVVDTARLNGTVDRLNIDELRRKLAMRGDQAWLGVLRPGRLDIYATDLQPAEGTKPVSFFSGHADSLGVVARLAQGDNLAEPSTRLLRSVLFGLMADAGQELKTLGLSTDETIALTGRALFFRYLIGRKIISTEHLPAISPGSQSLMQCFSSEQGLLETNTWLDETFNGDLLALPVGKEAYSEYFQGLYRACGTQISRPLEAILGLDQPIAPGASQCSLNWGDLDFDHLPVGLLSETYEELMYRFDAEARRDTSVYYTPTHIAEYMVGEAFHQHPAGAAARILDPACGAGVFLVACFRKLAELSFAETGQRPDRGVLRRILDEQLVGFDINAHARTLAALALYLTALELDPDPTPVEALTFKKLEGRVLVDVADPGSDPKIIQPMAGSLGPHVPDSFGGAFDLVIGNPPWTSLKPAYKAIDQLFTQRCRAVATGRGLDDIARSYKNPDQVPDLPFVWGAMDWAKPGGRIALALAGRWLFKMSEAGFAARSAIFRALSVTGILNGASIRQSKVWPNVDQPFCLVFADNRLPTESDQFVLVSPEDEPSLNDKGRMRIDASDAIPIALDLAAKQPALIKTLYRGSALDLSIVNRIRAKSNESIGEYWIPARGLYRGQGYIVGTRSDDDAFLEGYLKLGARYSRHPHAVLTDDLLPYQPEGLQWPRNPKIYRAPLVLVREGLKADRNLGRALYCSIKLAYSESYYGFSAAENSNGEFYAQYLLVLVHSQLFEYWSLMTSAKFGVEREALQLHDVESFPLVPPETLCSAVRTNIEECAKALLDNQPDWEELDTTVAGIYGLGRYDQEVIADTLTTRAPFSDVKKNAAMQCSPVQLEHFCARLLEELSAVLSVSGYAVHVTQLPDDDSLPWKFIAISLDKHALPEALPSTWVKYAEDLAVSRITIVDANRPLIIVGLLDRYSYWTQTQARLLSSDILWQYGALLEERAGR